MNRRNFLTSISAAALAATAASEGLAAATTAYAPYRKVEPGMPFRP